MEQPSRTIDDNLTARMLRALLIVTLAAALPLPPRVPSPARERVEPGDTARYLRDLASPSGELRREATRWLARHLRLQDREAVLAAARSGDAQSRRLLLEALADDDRHLALAVALAIVPEAREIGRGAIGELIARWQSGQDRAGLAQAKLFEWLAERSDEPLHVEARGRSVSLAVALDEVARFSPASIEIVLAPELDGASDPRIPRAAITGRMDVVLAELASHHGVQMEGFGTGDDAPSDARPWIHVFAPARRHGSPTACDLMVDWCVAAADVGGRNSARALASTGWPAALTWFESRWRASADPAALDALLLAARRGRVAPVLFDISVQRDLYARMSRASASASASELSLAEDIARALAATGPSGGGSEDLGALALEGFDAAPARERWLRLVVMEGHARGAPAIDALITAPQGTSIPPALRFQLLRTRATASRGSNAESELINAGGGRELLEWLGASGRLESALPALCDSRTIPSKELRDPRGLPDGARAAAIEWFFAAGERDVVAEYVATAKRPLDGLASQALRWVRAGRTELWRESLDIARERPGADRDAIDCLAIQSGAADDALSAGWLDRWLVAAPTARDELMALAALSASLRGAEARTALIGTMRGPREAEDVADALSFAWSELVAARREEDERAFIKAERGALRDAPEALRERLRNWPGRPAAKPRVTSDLDRRLDLSGL